jgi:two-component system chemotaxis response regulator CheY
MANVLVVDDSTVMRKNLRSLLSQAGYSVADEAVNGVDAYKKYKQHKPDFVTMDINMPDADGIEGVKLILKDFPDARIIMVSAIDQREMVVEALKAGAKHYILKPVTLDKIIEVISKVAK